MKISQLLESKYLTKDDATLDGTVVTIKSFEQVNLAQEGKPPEITWVMYFREFAKGMVMKRTNIQLCKRALGSSDDTDLNEWIGKKIVIFDDPSVTFGKELVGGIRIRAFRPASAPRQMDGNGHADDFDTGSSGAAPLAQVEQELLNAAHQGMDAFKLAWLGKSDDVRNALRNTKLSMYKEVAAQADAARAAQKGRQPGDDFSDMPQ